MASSELQGYKIQGIYYLNKRTHRIQQNVGGACPLLALCNTLFLNHQIHYNKGGRRIKFEELTDCLTLHLHNMLNVDSVDGHKVKTELKLKVDKHKTKDDKHLFSNLSIDDDDEDDDDPVTATTLFEDSDIDLDIDSLSRTQTQTLQQEAIECKDKEQIMSFTSNANTDTETKECKDIDHKHDALQETQPQTSSTEQDTNELEAADPKAAEMQKKLKIIEECVQLFPKLEEGLDINIKFSDCCDFEENPGYRMFAHYGFKLFHGWVVDPKEEELHRLIGDKSYDETIDFLISDPPNTATEEEKKELEDNKDVVRKFFAESATQLTSYGLERLYSLMDVEDILAIFFRNNHFSTIVKHAGIMYEFVTDEGIVDADPQITWQTLLQISGDEQFVNNKFQSIHTNISQYTQIAQYNRIKFQQDNPNIFDDENSESKHNKHKSKTSGDKVENDELINIINDALDYIDSESFTKIAKEEDDDIDPLLSHGLTQRTTDTLDRFICKDLMYGITLHNAKCDANLSFKVRHFVMKDAQNILNLMCNAHDSSYEHFKNIDFMHDDAQFALIIEMTTSSQKEAMIVGCCKYEWTKFNFWDWRESDWEDYDMDSVYNMSNTKYQRQRLLRESGVRCDYFVHILDLAIAKEYAHRGLGAQLLQCLIYGFASHSKFGVEVPATNTPAVKCFTKCGFTIARVEQTYGTKYKMTEESSFSVARYRSFLHDSIVVIPKETLTKEKETEKEKSNRIIPQLDHDLHDIDMDIDDMEADDTQSQEENTTRNKTHIHNIRIPDGIQAHKGVLQHESHVEDDNNRERASAVAIDGMDGTEEYEDDSRGDDDDDDDIEDHDIDGIHAGQSVGSRHRHHAAQDVEQQSVIHQRGGDIMGSINNMGGLFGYGAGDRFILTTLIELDLTKYNQIFTEFNINKDALLHLDPAVVEFMINDEKDRKKFLNWLQKYKEASATVAASPSIPSNAPAQHSTNIKTGHSTKQSASTDIDTHAEHQHDPVPLDTDDEL